MGDELAPVQHADAVGEFLRDVQEVGGHQDGHAGMAAGLEFLLHGLGMDGVLADHGLVNDEEIRFMQQGGGDGEPLAVLHHAV